MNDNFDTLRREALRQRHQKKLETEIGQEKEHVERNCLNYEKARTKEQHSSSALNYLMENQLEFVSIKLQIKVGYFLIFFVLVCSYFFNLLLIYRPVEYLVDKNITFAPLAAIAKAILPFAFIVFYLGIATTIYLIKDVEKPVSKWLGKVAILITPCMLLATNIALFTAERRTGEPHEFILLASLLTLAFICDLILFAGYRSINEAIAYIFFAAECRRLEAIIKNSQKESRQFFLLANRSYDRYIHRLQDYNHTYPHNAMQPPSFTNLSKEVTDRWQANDKSSD